MRTLSTLTLLTLGALALGCNTMPNEKQAKHDDPWAAQPPVAMLPAQPGGMVTPTVVQANGSLWRHGESQSLFVDATARRLFDIVMVDVIEEVGYDQEADLETQRGATVNLAIPNFGGLENEINTVDDGTPDSGVDLNSIIAANSQNDYDAESEQTRESRLEARISAQVVEVFPNGNLRIHGSQVVRFDQDDQIITIDGIARPIDISAENTINSNRLADARISLTGVGPVADGQRPGWGTRMLAWIWPF